MADFNRVEETLRDAEIKMFDCNSKMVMQGLSVKRVPSLLYFRYGIPTFFDGEMVAVGPAFLRLCVMFICTVYILLFHGTVFL